MKDKLNIFFKLQSQIYRIILFFLSVAFIVYIIPKKGKFQYDFELGKPWKYETLIAPFDFLIQKTKTEFEFEKLDISKNSKKYFIKSQVISDSLISKIILQLKDSVPYLEREALIRLNKIYNPGLVNNVMNLDTDSIILISDINVKSLKYNQFNQLNNFNFDSIFYKSTRDSVFFNSIIKLNLEPDIIYDDITTERNKTYLLNQITKSKGLVNNGVRIISRGEIIDSEKLSVLKSLKLKFESQIWSKSNYNLMTLGYSIIVGITLFFLLLFLKKNRLNVYLDNTKITFIFLIVLICSLDFWPKNPSDFDFDF